MKILKIILILAIVFFLLVFISSRNIPIGQEYTPQEVSQQLMENMRTGLDLFKVDNGTYPLQKEGLEALIVNPNPKKYLNYASNAYMKNLSLDSWKNPFIYLHYQTDKGDKFQIISFGADGKYGGEGENADIIYPNCQK